MPTYEYVCQKCDHQFELVQSIKDKSLKVCPKERCPQKKWGKGKVKKLIVAGGGLIFKGSGFYITDYRSEKYKEAARKDSAAAPATGSDSKPSSPSGATKSSKPDNKPAAKPSAPTSTK